MHGAPDSERNQQTNKNKHHIFAPTALCDLPQTLRGDRARRDHPKRYHPFFDFAVHPGGKTTRSTHSFSYRVHGKIWPNLPMRGFSAITP